MVGSHFCSLCLLLFNDWWDVWCWCRVASTLSSTCPLRRVSDTNMICYLAEEPFFFFVSTQMQIQPHSLQLCCFAPLHGMPDAFTNVGVDMQSEVFLKLCKA